MATKWAIQVQVYEMTTERCSWAYVHPSDSTIPYTYDTKEEARRMAEMCYHPFAEVRIVEWVE